MKILPPTEDALVLAAELLRADEVVAYPTETVYGLAVNPRSPKALERLFTVKGRGDGKPVLLIVDDAARLASLVRVLDAAARQCMDAFWPGPLSLLLPAAAGLPTQLTGGKDKVCVRCPGCETARALCRVFGGALTSTSANRAGEAPACSVGALDLDGVALALDGGSLAPSTPSTVYDPATGKVLRAGAIPKTALARLR